MRFELAEVVSESPTLDLELEFIRNLRNSVRSLMTGSQRFIASTEQFEWFESLDHERLKLFLFWVDDEPAGYGIINIIDDFPWLTGVLLQEFRGKGYGKILFKELTKIALENSAIVYLNAFESNKNAVGMYKSLGFSETGKSDGIVTMEYMEAQ